MPDLLALTVDLVVFTVRSSRLQVMLVRRGIEPFAGRWALPGGYVRTGEDLTAAAYRELDEETGLSTGIHLEQLATYGAVGRDPRERTVTVAHIALTPAPGTPSAGGDAAAAEWIDIADASALPLAFDHATILADGLERARNKLEYTSLATSFCPPEFTVAQLRAVYEAVWGRRIDPRNFHRKATKTPGFIEPTGELSTVDRGRPAQLYRRGSLELLHPPLTRGES